MPLGAIPLSGQQITTTFQTFQELDDEKAAARADHQTGRPPNIGAGLVRLPAPCGGRDTACHHPPPSRREGHSGRSDAGARRRQAPSPRGDRCGRAGWIAMPPLDLIAAREPQWCMAQTQSGRRNISPSPRAIRSIVRVAGENRALAFERPEGSLSHGTPYPVLGTFPGPQESPE